MIANKKGSQQDVGNDSFKISTFHKTWEKESAIIYGINISSFLAFGREPWPAMVGWNSCHLGSEIFYGWWKMKKDSSTFKKTVWVKKTGVNTIPKSP